MFLSSKIKFVVGMAFGGRDRIGLHPIKKFKNSFNDCRLLLLKEIAKLQRI